MKNLPTLHNDSSFVVQYWTIHSFEDKGNFAVYDKDCQNFWTPHKQKRIQVSPRNVICACGRNTL